MTEHDTLTETILDRPCPAWCELQPGHDWDSAGDGYVTRGHGSEPFPCGGRGYVGLWLAENATATVPRDLDDGMWTDPVTDAGPSYYPKGTVIVIDTDNATDFTSEQARTFAAAIVAAANRLDLLNATDVLDEEAAATVPRVGQFPGDDPWWDADESTPATAQARRAHFGHVDERDVPAYCTCGKLTTKCPMRPREWRSRWV